VIIVAGGDEEAGRQAFDIPFPGRRQGRATSLKKSVSKWKNQQQTHQMA